MMLNSLQACRALAAILVVLSHTSGILSLPKYLGVKPFGPAFDFGFVGVDFFFVLSGFIIMHVHARDIGQPRAFGAYLWKRFSRAYPPYWIVLMLILPVFFLMPHLGIGHERDPDVVVRSIFLLPHPQDHTVLVVSWTMVYEILFYLLFGVLVINKRLGTAIFLGWTACVLASPGFENFPWTFLFSPWHIRILAGVGVAMVLHCWRVPAPRAVAVVGVFLLLFTSMFHAYQGPVAPSLLTLGCTLGSALTILGLVEIERTGALPVPRILVYLGDATYAIYLVHFPALSILAKLAKVTQLDVVLPGMVLFPLLVGCAIGVGCMFYHLVDHPLHRWSKRFFRSAKPAAALDAVPEPTIRKAA